MAFVTPIDRLLQAGSDGVTALFWLLAVGGAVSFALTDLPEPLSLTVAGVGTTVYWMRFRSLTIADLIRRILLTRARRGDHGD